MQWLTYLQVFVVGGLICVIGQLLINFTKMTSSRILVIFLLLGVLLEAVGVFKYIAEFGQAGITVPITGFGSNLAKGAIKGAAEKGIWGAIIGGTQAAASGLAGAIAVGFLVALVSKSKTK